MAKPLGNRYKMPELAVEVMAQFNDHPMGGAKYSATQLIKPPQALQLERRHEEEIRNDASDFWAMFVGTGVHNILDKYLVKNTDKYIVEKQMVIEVDGVKVKGTFDLYDKENRWLIDHKTMKCVQYGMECKPEYEAQLNIYAYMMEQLGYDIAWLYVHAIYMDWRSAAVKTAIPGKYPAAPTALVSIPKWTTERVEAYLKERVRLHEEAETKPDEELPPCSKEEVWESPACWAIYNKGGLKARKLAKSPEEVESWVKSKGLSMSSMQIYKRPVTRRRCEEYCSGSKFCAQYKAWLASTRSAEDVTEVSDEV